MTIPLSSPTPVSGGMIGEIVLFQVSNKVLLAIPLQWIQPFNCCLGFSAHLFSFPHIQRTWPRYSCGLHASRFLAGFPQFAVLPHSRSTLISFLFNLHYRQGASPHLYIAPLIFILFHPLRPGGSPIAPTLHNNNNTTSLKFQN